MCPERAEFHADRQTNGRTDKTKLTVAFCNFAKAPKSTVDVTAYLSKIEIHFLLRTRLQYYNFRHSFL